MISREEFNHQLQTGKVREALASVLHSLNELDITTQIAATDSLPERLLGGAVGNACAQRNRPYFRTKIDLLSGRVIDEVSSDFADGDRHLDLQQLHAERVAASYALVRDYLVQIESLLSAMSNDLPERDATVRSPLGATHTADERSSACQQTETASFANGDANANGKAAPTAQFHPLRERPMVTQPKSPPPALVAKLQQARASLTSRLGGDTTPAMLFPSRTVEAAPTEMAAIDRVDFDDDSDEMAIVLETPPLLERGLSEDDLAAVATIVDEEIDLAIEENGELWAGWVEEDSDDEDEYNLEAILPQPPANPTLLDWQEIPTPKYVDAIEVKPIIPRPVARSLDPIAQWDKFEPDYLGIDFDPQPAIKKHLPIDN